MNYQDYTIQRSTETKNAIGEVVESWSDLGTIQGHKYQLSGSEQYQSNRDTRVIKDRIHANNPEFEIKESDRVVVDGEEYDIEVVNILNKLGFNKIEIDLKLVR